MAMVVSLHLLALLLLQISSSLAARPPSTKPTSTVATYVQRCCMSTSYPRLCYDSLSCYSNEIQNNPRILATKALTVALSSAKSASLNVKKLSTAHGLSRRVAGVMADCVTVVADSVYELQRSVGELSGRDVGGFEFSKIMSDVQTWVSAALTDENTCMDGFDDQGPNDKKKSGGVVVVRGVVRGQVLKVAQLTSNALALVNNFANTKKEQS